MSSHPDSLKNEIQIWEHLKNLHDFQGTSFQESKLLVKYPSSEFCLLEAHMLEIFLVFEALLDSNLVLLLQTNMATYLKLF